MNKRSCIVIVGPTAVGKTSLAVQMAQEFNTQIISADSRQCFRELNIGVAKPSLNQLRLIKHHFIDSHFIQQDVNACLFEQYALAAVDRILEQNDTAVLAGGTGLYVKAFCEGMDEIPGVSSSVRHEIKYNYEKFGLAWLQDQVKLHDSDYYMNGEILNPQRLMRSLEVKLSTGRSIRSYQTQQKKNREFNIIKIGLRLPVELLYLNINHRVDEMIKNGLVEEVNTLLPYRHLHALNTVGYKELFNYLIGKSLLEEAIDAIKMNTRHYAKRQMTWFEKDKSIAWFSPGDFSSIKEYCRLFINSKLM